jgi:hypothetical protein
MIAQPNPTAVVTALAIVTRQPGGTSSIWYTMLAGRAIEASAITPMKPSPTAPHCGTSASGSRLRANPPTQNPHDLPEQFKEQQWQHLDRIPDPQHG